MLIRRPAAEVFAAFVDPSITTKFWFTKSSGRLEAGKKVRWDWEMYGASTDVLVKEIEANRRIVIEWSSYNGVTTVEWTFTPRSENETCVVVTDSGFEGDGDEIVKNAIESTGGFNIVLCGLKALLEHGVELNLIQDVHPDAVVKS
jgi:uncharacterized protein YndB with AHSA1/START domain